MASAARLPAGLIPAEPTLERLEELVACAERRRKRASEKLAQAQTEEAEAIAALERAEANRTNWIENHPDPQMMMF